MKKQRHFIALAVLVSATFGTSTNATAIDKSKGVYRIPYQNGTSVKVSRDHKKHTPLGRIDMGGERGKYAIQNRSSRRWAYPLHCG